MKKKIAVFANGLNAENLMKYMKGIKETCSENFADFHVFLGHDSFGSSDEMNRAEWCIYSLPNLRDYDGAIIFGAGLNYSDICDSIVRKCKAADIPTICISSDYEGMISIHTDNYEGMKLMADHMLDEHNITKAVFIAGPKDNAESNDRLRAVKDAFRVRNLPFEDDRICYSNWVSYMATGFVRDIFAKGEDVPEVIMCANDNLAHFVGFVLEDMGIKCPEEVLLTGFDGDYQAMTFYPSITTVVQPFYEMGVKTIECFNDIFNGIDVENNYYIPCSLRIAESCGCDVEKEYDEHRRKFSINTYRDQIISDLHLYRIQCLMETLIKSDSYSNIDKFLQEFFYESDGFEGNPFYICMDPNFAKLNDQDVSNLPQYTFGNYFHMLVGKDGDKKYDTIKFDISNGLIPVKSEDSVNHIFVFMPIYNKSFVGGYIIASDNIEYFGISKYNFLHTHINRLLEQYKKNMQLTYLNARLSQLMNTDVLTSTKNRMAFEVYKQNIAKDVESGRIKDVAFLVADINNLKYINDNLGHECGDEYIKNASEFICSNFKHSPVFRMGGDEFFVVLRGEDFDNRFEFARKMGEAMFEMDKNEKDPVKNISIAFSFADYDASIDKNVDDTVKRADALMYENKRRYKLEKGEK